MLLLLATIATPAPAATVNWFDSGQLTSVNESYAAAFLPGLTVGTPWSLQVNFDPNAQGTPGFDPSGGSHCFSYPISSAAFSLGGFTYTTPQPGSTGARIWTNADLPGFGCSPSPTGAVVFEMALTSADPGAWDLNGLLLAGYTDALARDGSLPSVPTLTGLNTGLTFYDFSGGNAEVVFQDRTFAPMADAPPVPEPATFGMLGIGLACLARRLRRTARSID